MSDFVKRLLILSIYIPVIIGFIGTSIYLRSSIEKTARDIATKHAILLSQQSLSQSIGNLTKDKIIAEPYAALLDRAFPTQDGLIGFPAYWNTLAKKTGVTSSFSFSTNKADPTSDTPGFIAFSASANGSLVNLLSFLGDIYQGRYFVGIDSVDFTGTSGGYTLLMSGKVYFK